MVRRAAGAGGRCLAGGAGMITVASVDYCERCRCRTLHVPLPSGERACEHHPPGPELAAPPARGQAQAQQPSPRGHR